MIHIGVLGNGRMGRLVAEEIAAAKDDCMLAGIATRDVDGARKLIAESHVVIDFTAPVATPDFARAALHGVARRRTAGEAISARHFRECPSEGKNRHVPRRGVVQDERNLIFVRFTKQALQRILCVPIPGCKQILKRRIPLRRILFNYQLLAGTFGDIELKVWHYRFSQVI